MDVLQQPQWLPLAEEHRRRAEQYTEPYLQRRSAGKPHPVEDFLFTYYTEKPGRLLRWHPGAGVVLCGSAAAERTAWKYYRPLAAAERALLGIGDGAGPAVTVDVTAFFEQRREAVQFAAVILGRTADRPARFGCFGLHEWAMAYKSAHNGVRHRYLDLRLGAAGTDAVVEGSRIQCTHFDAFRFYAPEAAPLNTIQPTRQSQRELEQPGCLHANMDLYKWAYKLAPLLPSQLVMDCFELAWRIRAVDMRASPYDLRAWGYEPIGVETSAGRAEYVQAQKGFSEQAQQLRERLLEAVRNAQSLTAAGAPGGRAV